MAGATRHAWHMHVPIVSRIRHLFIKELKVSVASNTCSMIRKQRKGICNIHKLIRRRCRHGHWWCGNGRACWKCTKREHIFIKHNVTRDVDAICRNMEALVPFVKETIPEKNTLLRLKL